MDIMFLYIYFVERVNLLQSQPHSIDSGWDWTRDFTFIIGFYYPRVMNHTPLKLYSLQEMIFMLVGLQMVNVIILGVLWVFV